jgi:hypothetical protein
VGNFDVPCCVKHHAGAESGILTGEATAGAMAPGRPKLRHQPRQEPVHSRWPLSLLVVIIAISAARLFCGPSPWY